MKQFHSKTWSRPRKWLLLALLIALAVGVFGFALGWQPAYSGGLLSLSVSALIFICFRGESVTIQFHQGYAMVSRSGMVSENIALAAITGIAPDPRGAAFGLVVTSAGDLVHFVPLAMFAAAERQQIVEQLRAGRELAV